VTETWLHPNRRALWLGCIPALVVGGVGLILWRQQSDSGLPWRWVAAAMIVVAALALVVLLVQIRQPRIAYRDGKILFNLRAGPSIAVPADIVEAFFIGQGPAHLPAGIAPDKRTMNLVARLSQQHEEWMQCDVKAELGSWAEGYVTIRGTWCEPLHPELVRRLNRRLKEVKSGNALSPT
jgi:hypothetical protein